MSAQTSPTLFGQFHQQSNSHHYDVSLLAEHSHQLYIIKNQNHSTK